MRISDWSSDVCSSDLASEIVQRIRGTAAKHMPDRISLDLNDIVEEAMLFVGHDIETRAIELTLTSTPLPVAMGDRVQLQQVIVNLLVNSIQAIPNAGKIFVANKIRPDTTVSITIYDIGKSNPHKER